MPKTKIRVKFCLTKLTITFYLPFSDIPGLLKLQEKNKTPEIKKCYRNNRVTAKLTDSIAKVTKDSFPKDLAEACYLEVWIVALLRKNLCMFSFLCVVSQRLRFFPLNQLIMPKQKIFIVALRKLLNELECQTFQKSDCFKY